MEFITKEERAENALNELKALGYFGFYYWGPMDIQQAFDEINAERDEDIEDDYAELSQDESDYIVSEFENKLSKNGEADFEDLKTIVENIISVRP